MKILVVAPAWIGDTVMMQPMLMLLHQRYPGLSLDVLATNWVVPILERMPEIHQIIHAPFRHAQLGLLARYRLAQKVKKNQYQQVIVLPNSWKSALLPWFAKIPRRTGFKGEWRYGLLNDIHQRMPGDTQVQEYAKLACINKKSNPPSLPKLHLVSTTHQQVNTLQTLELTMALNSPPIIFCIGAEYGPAKRWPIEYFGELAKKFCTVGDTVWLVGTEKDKLAGDSITFNHQVVNLCGLTSLTQAIDLLAIAKHVVCNDSGLMLITSALHRPLTAIFGSSSLTRTPPLSNKARIVSVKLPCSPCFKRNCPLGHLDCLKNLTPELVWQSIKST